MALFTTKRRSSILTDALLGAAAGGIASAVMVPVMRTLHNMERPEAKTHEEMIKPSEMPSEKVARKLAEPFNIQLGDAGRKTGATLVHFAYGMSWGAVFGILAERVPIPHVLHGLLFGAVLTGLSAQVILPAFKLSPPASRYKIDTNLAALGSHLVYGATAERSLTLLRHALLGKKTFRVARA